MGFGFRPQGFEDIAETRIFRRFTLRAYSSTTYLRIEKEKGVGTPSWRDQIVTDSSQFLSLSVILSHIRVGSVRVCD